MGNIFCKKVYNKYLNKDEILDMDNRFKYDDIKYNSEMKVGICRDVNVRLHLCRGIKCKIYLCDKCLFECIICRRKGLTLGESYSNIINDDYLIYICNDCDRSLDPNSIFGYTKILKYGFAKHMNYKIQLSKIVKNILIPDIQEIVFEYLSLFDLNRYSIKDDFYSYFHQCNK